MPERLAPGVWHEGVTPARPGSADVERAQQKRDGAVWLMVAGVGMMFLGSVSVGMAIGGAAMTLTGAAGTILYGRRLRKLKGDPWDDAEIDDWEKEHFGSWERKQ